MGRMFIKEGTLVTKKGSNSSYSHLILLNDMLLITTFQKEKYKLRHKILLNSLTVEDVPNAKGKNKDLMR